MTGQLRLAQYGTVDWISDGEGAAAKSRHDTFRCGIVPHVVGIVAEMDRANRMKVRRVDHLDAVALAVCHGDEPAIRDEGDSLRLAKALERFQVRRALEIEDFHGVVTERRHVQPLRRNVGGEMIDAALDAW
jgi:hypothetical protein